MRRVGIEPLSVHQVGASSPPLMEYPLFQHSLRQLHCALAAFTLVGDSVSFSYELLPLERLGEYVNIHERCRSVHQYHLS